MRGMKPWYFSVPFQLILGLNKAINFLLTQWIQAHFKYSSNEKFPKHISQTKLALLQLTDDETGNAIEKAQVSSLQDNARS